MPSSSPYLLVATGHGSRGMKIMHSESMIFVCQKVGVYISEMSAYILLYIHIYTENLK